MSSLETLGHTMIVVGLGSVGYAIGGHIPAITPFLNESIGTVFSLGLSWAYIHFGIVQPAIAVGKTGRV